MPKVSIITPNYNSAKYIQATYDSVVSQSFQDWEWLIVDDCSKDGSFEIISNFANRDSRIKVHKNPKNSGASVSRNKGLEEATGEYIAFLDADDLWNEHKLAEQLRFMDENHADFSIHNFDMINFDGTFQKSMFSPDTITQATLERFNPIFTSSVMMRRSKVKDVRFKVELRRRQDYIYWYECVKLAGKAPNVGKNLASYRVGNSESLSSNKFQNIGIQWNIYRNEFHMGFFKSSKSIVAYAFHGIKKYFL